MENILKDNIDVLRSMANLISSETGCNIIICDHEGEIIAATLEERIGRKHLGSAVIRAGEADEAVITEEKEEENRKIGSDTRKGYNYVINILGQRVGSLGASGEPEFLKPIVRAAAKMIGIYISEYLKEKEKNNILQKMAGIAEEIANQPHEKINYQIFADDLRHISGAKYVFFDIYNTAKQSSAIIAVSAAPEDLRRINEFTGCPILGRERNNNNLLRTESKGIACFDSVVDFPCNLITKDRRTEFQNFLNVGQVCILEIAHKGKSIGDFILFMEHGELVHNRILLELYAAQAGQLLMRAQAESALKKSERELKKSEAELKEALSILDSFWEHSPSPIGIFDKQGKIIRISKSASELLGYPAGDLEGRSIAQIFPAAAKEFFWERLQELNKEQQSLHYCDVLQLTGAADRHFDLWVFPISSHLKNKSLIGLVALDVTDRKHNEEQFKYLSHHDSLTGLYNRTYFEKVIQKLNNDRCEYPITIISLDADGLKIINDTMGHNKGDILLKNLAKVLKSSLRDEDILARIGGDEFIIILPRSGGITGEMTANRIKDSISVYNQNNPNLPISVSLGICTVEEPGNCLEEVMKKADELMYNNKISQIENSRSQIINSLIIALAERDYITQGHVRRLSEFCMKVGERCNLPPKVIVKLLLLARVHDLGKVSVPDYILFKAGPLTDEEWELIHQHPEKGYRIAIASSSPELKEIADLILKHHERWDGQGYPLGLKNEEIPLECRILSIVDGYDVMINKRPYKVALTKAEAVEELKRCAGSQFDPALVEVFLEILEEQSQAERIS